MKTILVSGASGVVGYGVLKSLRSSGQDYRLVGTTIYDDSVAPAFCDIFEQAPLTSDPAYIDWLIKIIEKYQVDLLIPGIEADMLCWNQNRDKLSETGAKPLLNNPELIELCSDKWNFYEKLNKLGAKCLIESRIDGNYEDLKNDFGLPFLLKPRRGFGSKGIIKVDSEETFTANKAALGSMLMAQPIVGTNEEEYTVSAFFDNNSNLCCLMALRRKLATEGYTEKAQTVDLPGAKEQINNLAKLLKPIGPTNFQFRRQDDELKLLEINPRVSSATSIRTAFGYNESAMSIEYFLNNVVPTQPVIKSGYAVRYVEEHVFYDSRNI